MTGEGVTQFVCSFAYKGEATKQEKQSCFAWSHIELPQ